MLTLAFSSNQHVRTVSWSRLCGCRILALLTEMSQYYPEAVYSLQVQNQTVYATDTQMK